MSGYDHRSIDDFETNPDKPGRRWELSPSLGLDGYNFNVAVIEGGEPLSESGYHYHENQQEFFYVVDGRCQVEVEDGAFRLRADEVVRFDEGVVHLLHNPFEAPAKLVAVGSPSDGRYPVHQVAPAAELLRERYGTATPDPVADETD
jgi:mannose-6-phosphate isomerase-like protein (cupin superfamily)